MLFRAGGGTAVFAAEGEDLRPKVMTQLKNAMQPSISEVKVKWDGLKVCFLFKHLCYGMVVSSRTSSVPSLLSL